MKRYEGYRTWEGLALVLVQNCTGGRELPMRLDLWKHSPTGPEWGYCGSGPAQLALALLADASESDSAALDFHQKFKVEIVAQLHKSGWVLDQLAILRWLIKAMAEFYLPPLEYTVVPPVGKDATDGK